jgi:hypothetical protein
MLRDALAHLLHAVADRIDPVVPEPEIQYVYIYSNPATTTIQQWPVVPWQNPITWQGLIITNTTN